MWDHYERTVAAGLPAPTGADLDKVARTNNYGRAVLRKWRRKGRTPEVPPAGTNVASISLSVYNRSRDGAEPRPPADDVQLPAGT